MKTPDLNLSIKKNLSALSKNSRMLLATSIAWFVWVIVRSSDDLELFGFFLDSWDEDMLLTNALLPIAAAWLTVKTYLFIPAKKRRLIITASVAWSTWVIFRSWDDWEFLGIDLDGWNEDMLIVNMVLPVLAVILAYRSYQWILEADI